MKNYTLFLSLLLAALCIPMQLEARRKKKTITKIEYFERTGTIQLGTTAGKRNALTFSIDTAACDK